jgi:hypothetical protein
MLYLDESGDHNLKNINPVYPVFVLGGVIVDRSYVRDVIEPRMREFKERFFGRDDVILHTVDMGKGRGDYAFLADPDIRIRFYGELNAMLAELDYKVVACVIRKPEHVSRYGVNAIDPYMYSLKIIVERFCKELGNELDNGFICAEKRNPGLDRELLAAWEELVNGGGGTSRLRSKDIDARIVGFDLKDKKPNLAGMQLADLVITPIGRHVAGLPPRPFSVAWTVVESKLRRVDGVYMGNGLVIRP